MVEDKTLDNDKDDGKSVRTTINLKLSKRSSGCSKYILKKY